MVLFINSAQAIPSLKLGETKNYTTTSDFPLVKLFLNYSMQNVNRSDYWDNLNTPADIGTSELNNDAGFLSVETDPHWNRNATEGMTIDLNFTDVQNISNLRQLGFLSQLTRIYHDGTNFIILNTKGHTEFSLAQDAINGFFVNGALASTKYTGGSGAIGGFIARWQDSPDGTSNADLSVVQGLGDQDHLVTGAIGSNKIQTTNIFNARKSINGVHQPSANKVTDNSRAFNAQLDLDNNDISGNVEHNVAGLRADLNTNGGLTFSSATITDSIKGVDVDVDDSAYALFGGGSITSTIYGAFIDIVTGNSGNAYGVFINQITGGTNNYGFYNNGTAPNLLSKDDVNNYFGTDEDMSIRFDSGTGHLLITDEVFSANWAIFDDFRKLMLRSNDEAHLVIKTAGINAYPELIFDTSRGTLASRSQNLKGDYIGVFQANAYDSAGGSDTIAGIDFRAAEDQTGSNHGGEIIFSGNKLGSTATTNWLIMRDGDTNVTGVLNVNQYANLKANTTAISCVAGNIYYDGIEGRHAACNKTNDWNWLY